MGQQRTLFEAEEMENSERAEWMRRIWSRIDPAKRQEIVSTLAEMGKASMVQKPAIRSKEGSDES